MSTRPETPAPDDLHIRPLAGTDIPALMRLERATFGEPWSEATFRDLSSRADADLLVAELDGRLVGYATVWAVEDQAELGNLAVDETARGHGLGRRLLDAALDRLRERGVTECFLEVRASNTAARRLYESAGFRRVGRRPNYYRQPREDALVMRLSWPSR